MAQALEAAELALEAIDPLGVRVPQPLQRDASAALQVDRLVDDTHAADPETAHDLEAPRRCGRGQRRVMTIGGGDSALERFAARAALSGARSKRSHASQHGRDAAASRRVPAWERPISLDFRLWPWPGARALGHRAQELGRCAGDADGRLTSPRT